MPDQLKYQDDKGEWIIVPLSRESEISISFKVRSDHAYPFKVKYEEEEYLFSVGASGAVLNGEEDIEKGEWYPVMDTDEVSFIDPKKEKIKTRVIFEIQSPGRELFMDRYFLIEKLSVREGKTVYKAKDNKLGRLLTIQKIDPKSLTLEEVHRFVRACSTTYPRLSHPNIALFIDYGVKDEFLYTCREYVEGKSLDLMLNEREKLDIYEGVEIAVKIGEALSYLHKKQIVHRAVNPRHIIVGEDGIAKLIGLSLAKSVVFSKDLTTDGAWLGEVDFASPEQMGEAKDVDRRSDIYSLGSLLYRMVCGIALFGAKSIGDYIRQVIGRIPPPSPTSMNIPPSLSQIIMKALQYSPQDRYQDISEMIDHIKKWLYGGKNIKKTISSPNQSVSPFPGLQIEIACEHYSEKGGDFFDFYPISKSKLVILLGEVYSEGSEALYLGPMIESMVRVLSDYNSSPSEILKRVNHQVHSKICGNTYVLASLGIIDIQSEKLLLTRAKHPPILICSSRTPKVQLLEPPGMVLGMVSGPTFQCKECVIDLKGGDILLFSSTGISQSRNKRGEELGMDPVSSILEETSPIIPLPEISQKIKDKVNSFSAGTDQFRDRTFILIRYDQGYQFSIPI